jgi:hypothetical protein
VNTAKALLSLTFLFLFNTAPKANNKIECLIEAQTSSKFECAILVLNSQESASGSDYNAIISRSIDLQVMIKSFKKMLAKQLNKDDCEKKVFIKSAKLEVEDQSLKLHVRARLNRLYCKRRARQQVYEKTDSLVYSLLPVVENNQIKFINAAIQKPKSDFEKSFSDVLDIDLSQKLSDALIQILAIDFSNLSFDMGIEQKSIKFQSVSINQADNSLHIKMTANTK